MPRNTLLARMKCQPDKEAENERGFALLMVLWALLLISFLTLGVARDTVTNIELTRSGIESARAEALADGGVHYAVARLMSSDLESNPTRFFHRNSFDAGALQIMVEDEDGKIDLNHGSDDLLRRLFETAGANADVALELVDQILAVRFADRVSQIRPDQIHSTREFGEMPGTVPFESILELRQISGFDQTLFAQIESSITVSSGSNGVDVRVAGPNVLRALPGITEATVSRLLQGKQLGTTRFVGDIASYLRTSRRSHYTIRSIAKMRSGAMFERIALIELTFSPRRPFIIHAWRQGYAPNWIENASSP